MPYSPHTITMKRGETVTLTLINRDPRQAHNLVIPALSFKSAQVPPGGRMTFTVTSAKAGTFQFYCDVPGHREAGMAGRVTVNE